MPRYTVSRLFQPRINVPKGKERGTEVLSKSQRLLMNLGLVRTENQGTNTILPTTMRALNKLINMIKCELNEIGAQELLLPALTPHQLLEKTGRSNMSELFKLEDRNGKKIILGPTHEESITHLIASIQPSYRDFPLAVYQISSKFRDEMKPKFGLLRSREFIMKDMYCFNSTSEDATRSYNETNECYRRLMRKLEVPYAFVEGCNGDIGGTISHEFHILSEIGEDRLVICKNCNEGENTNNKSEFQKCNNCGNSEFQAVRGIEVAHSFLLGTTYTEPLQAFYTSRENKLSLLEMSCHGIGISRLLAATIEALSSSERIKWPRSIAPFQVCLIPPKEGSKEDGAIPVDAVYSILAEKFPDDVIIDDRTDKTIGKRLTDAAQMGYPYVVVIGKSATEPIPTVEVINSKSKITTKISLADLHHSFS